MEWPEVIRLWNQTPVKLLDIRHLVIKQGEVLQAYRLPASAFLFANQGEARLMLGGIEESPVYSQILHGNKGDCLNIWCLNQQFDYYLILYKPMIDISYRGQQQPSPFEQQYAFRSIYPAALLSMLDRMNDKWSTGEELDKLEATGLFYQFVYEQFRQMQLSGEEGSPDLAKQIAEYIHEQYCTPISMEHLAHLFHYSTHYLSKVFKRKYGCSPIEYLTRTRMDRAKSLLMDTDIPVRDIAESIGYSDIYYFSRLFKKQTGETPAQYKMHSLRQKGSIRPMNKPELFIAPWTGERYIDNNDNHYQYNGWRVNEMKVSFKPSFAVTLLFSLSLLLAACGGTAAEPSENKENTEVAEIASAETRIYTDALGREVEIPDQPSKVVVITYGGYMLPLGLKPVGVDQSVLDLYQDEMADVESIGEGLGNVEAISALEPDLIILPDYYDQNIYTTYEQIAPTVAVAWGGDPDVINTLQAFGDIMNRKQEADEWIVKFEEKLQRVRDQVEFNIEPGATAVTFILYNGEVLLGGEGGTLGKLIYEDFGFQMPEQFKKYADGGGALSMEALVDKPADYFFTQMTDEEMEQMMELFSSPLYQSIPAVKGNRIINVTRDKWNYGPYLVEEAVDTLIEEVAKSQQ